MYKFILPVVLALGSLPSWGAISYSSEASLKATPGLTFYDIDMSGITGSGSQASFLLGPIPYQVTFGGGVMSLSNSLGGTWPAEYGIRRSSTGGSITIDLPSAVLAFGGYFGYIPGGALDVVISGVGDAPFSYTLSPGSGTQPVYLGVTSTAPFSTITLSPTFAPFTTVALSHFTIGIETPNTGGGGGDPGPGGGEVPEPSSMALMGGALIALPLIARRRRRTSQERS